MHTHIPTHIKHSPHTLIQSPAHNARAEKCYFPLWSTRFNAKIPISKEILSVDNWFNLSPKPGTKLVPCFGHPLAPRTVKFPLTCHLMPWQQAHVRKMSPHDAKTREKARCARKSGALLMRCSNPMIVWFCLSTPTHIQPAAHTCRTSTPKITYAYTHWIK